MRHVVEVDQSIKIEDTGATVLAFANGINDAIQVSASVKLTALQALRGQGRKPGIARRMIFAACLYLLLKDYLDQIEQIVIDTEYIGRESDVRAFLLRHIWRRSPDFESWRIEFRQIGKKSPAHFKAEAVRLKRDPCYRKVNSVDLLALLE